MVAAARQWRGAPVVAVVVELRSSRHCRPRRLMAHGGGGGGGGGAQRRWWRVAAEFDSLTPSFSSNRATRLRKFYGPRAGYIFHLIYIGKRQREPHVLIIYTGGRQGEPLVIIHLYRRLSLRACIIYFFNSLHNSG